MRTYTISELGPEAKEKALQSIMNDSIFRGREIDLDWVIENETEDLEALGLENVEIAFTGFWSQGDGASFTARVNDIPAFIKTIGVTDDILPKVLAAFEEVYEMRIVRTDSRYSHENTVRFEIEEIDDTELILMSPFGIGDITVDLDETLEGIELVKKASEWVKSKSREIYSKLEKAYNEEFSDETAEEWADSMGIEFDEEGNEV